MGLNMRAARIAEIRARELERHIALQRGAGDAVCGVDEAGRGAWAGPVVAAACVWPLGAPLLDGMDDSKRLSARHRETLAEQIRTLPFVRIGVGIADVHEVDELNVKQATMLAMRRALERLPGSPPSIALIDGDSCPLNATCVTRAVIGGDARCYSVAAASILAKTERDALMHRLDAVYPQYGFKSHVGYGTASHLSALREYGTTEHHRRSFRPIRELQNPRQ